MTIRPASTADASAIAVVLARTLAGGAPAHYRKYLDYRWLQAKPDLGWMIEDGGEVCGFIGAIYAERVIAGARARFCNLTSIAVKESHRRLTLRLFARLLAAPDLTFTCFTASPEVAKILDFFKFVHRPAAKVIVGPGSNLGRVWATRRVRIITDPAALDAALDDTERAIARDHRTYHCGQVLILDGTRRCFAVTVRRGRGSRAFADILYASDPELMMDCLPRLHLPMFRAHHTVLLGIDRTWITRRPRISFTYTKLRPIYLRSAAVRLDQLDALYSELVPMFG